MSCGGISVGCGKPASLPNSRTFDVTFWLQSSSPRVARGTAMNHKIHIRGPLLERIPGEPFC